MKNHTSQINSEIELAKNEELLAKKMQKLNTTIERIEKLQPFEIMRNRKNFLWYSFLHGMMVGFGSVLGASLLIAFFIFLLKQIQFAPLIGSFVQSILEHMKR